MRLRARRVVGQQAVAVVVEVADQRHVDAHAVELLADVGHRGGGLWRVDRDADHLGAGDREFLDLDRGADRVDRVGVRHRLDAHGRTAADRDDARAPAHLRLARAVRGRQRRFDEVVEGGRRQVHVAHGSGLAT